MDQLAHLALVLYLSLVSQDTPMAYIYTDHATRRMQKRGITRDQVTETVEQAEIRYPDLTEGRWVHLRTYGQRQLKVVIAQENDDLLVVTARPTG